MHKILIFIILLFLFGCTNKKIIETPKLEGDMLMYYEIFKLVEEKYDLKKSKNLFFWEEIYGSRNHDLDCIPYLTTIDTATKDSVIRVINESISTEKIIGLLPENKYFPVVNNMNVMRKFSYSEKMYYTIIWVEPIKLDTRRTIIEFSVGEKTFRPAGEYIAIVSNYGTPNYKIEELYNCY